MLGCTDCSENSSLTYSRCNPPISTNCTFYQGNNLSCSSDENFTICKGQNMSSVQTEIFERICKLIGDTNVSEVVIPACLIDAWNQSDYTILNLFNLALSNQCALDAQIVELGSTLNNLNPLVNVELCCCDTCNATTPPYQLRLSEALQKIVECVCSAKSEAATALAAAQNAQNTANILQTQVTSLQLSVASLVTANTQTQIRLACIETRLDNATEFPIANC